MAWQVLAVETVKKQCYGVKYMNHAAVRVNLLKMKKEKWSDRTVPVFFQNQGKHCDDGDTLDGLLHEEERAMIALSEIGALIHLSNSVFTVSSDRFKYY